MILGQQSYHYKYISSTVRDCLGLVGGGDEVSGLRRMVRG
jgi:hypothetical protein